MTAKDFIG